MDLLLDYRKDRNNGLSVIRDFTYQTGKSWGQPSMVYGRLTVPLSVGIESVWKIFSYVYNYDVDNWVFHQIFDVPSGSPGTFIRSAVSTNILGVLNNVSNQVHFYRLDEFGQWYLHQTTDLPHEETAYYSKRISAYDNYIAISDWAKEYGSSAGVVWIYMWHSVTNSFTLVKTIGNPGNSTDRFGEGLSINNGVIFIGAPRYNGLSGDGDGRVYVYIGGGDVWTYKEDINGENCVNGYFGWSLSSYVDGPKARLMVGARGYDNASGRVYFYHRDIDGNWGPNPVNYLDAPAPYKANENEFGYIVSIWNDQASISAGNELINQGAVYVSKWNGAAWVIDTTEGGVNPARFTEPGATNYGLFICQSQTTVFTVIQYSNSLFLNKRPTGWNPFIFMYIDNIYLKQTVDESFYHLATGNKTVVFKLTTPISGKFKVSLELANALATIGPQNDKVYFVENGNYKIAELTHGTYTGETLASHVRSRMNSVSTWPSNYFVEYNDTSNKFVVNSTYPFAFGSSDPNSLIDSCQNKTLGFYDNNNSIVHIIYASDVEAQLTSPTQIGVKIIEGYPVIPVRNNSIFAEIGMLANLDTQTNNYKILQDDNQIIRIPKKVDSLSFAFTCIDGGALLEINTNDLQVRLQSVN